MLLSDWEALAEWWVSEVAGDPAYESDVTPLLRHVMPAGTTGPVLDIGCGDGRVLRDLTADGVVAFGCDLSQALLVRAAAHRPVVRCRLPSLAWVADASLEGVVAVLVLEHLSALQPLLEEIHRVVRAGGFFAAVVNHPAYTAPGAGPVVDSTDGEVLWRWGPYFEATRTTEPAGAHAMQFHHRPLGDLLETAARAGWGLRRFEERPLSPAVIDANPLLAGQDRLPRLLGVCWVR